jgi:hypothetical protein
MKAVRINKYILPILAVLALQGSIWIAKAAGAWQTSGRGEVMLDESGQADPEGIKGWMTLVGVSETYGIPLDALYIMIGAGPDLPAETELKELEALLPGTGVTAIRAGVAAYRDGSWSPADGPFSIEPDEGEAPTPTATPAPTPASEVTPTPEALHTPQGTGEGTGERLVLPTDGSRLPASEIKGRMTLQQVVDYCQVPLEYLVTELRLPTNIDTGLLLRDVAASYGIEVTAIRDAVQRYQESH